jgi:CRP-like cAMP-binding protein
MPATAELGELLRSLPGVLSALDRGEMEELSQQLEEVTLATGEKLWRESDPESEGRFLAFVLEGELEVMKETDFPGKHIVLAVLHPGAVAGEVYAFGGNCRALTAIAASDCRLAVLPLAALDELSNNKPALGVKLLKGFLGVTAKRLDQSYQRLISVF